MWQRRYLFSAVILLVVCSSRQLLLAREPEVRRALPAVRSASVAPASPIESQETPENLRAAGVAVALTPSSLSALPIYPSTAPVTVANSAIMIDARTGSIIFFKNPDARRPVASTQKLLTGLLVAEHGGLESKVRVMGDDCAVEPTKLGVRPGEVYTK